MIAVIDKHDAGLNNGCQEDNEKLKIGKLKIEVDGGRTG